MEKEDIIKFACYVKYKRNLKGMSQEELAEKVNISIKTIGSLERGATNITLQNLYSIAKILDIDLGVLTNPQA
ncbi:MAG: helix-turn-helix transcriptional regulator [Candidatus Gastranaerophilales bacterium]